MSLDIIAPVYKKYHASGGDTLIAKLYDGKPLTTFGGEEVGLQTRLDQIDLVKHVGKSKAGRFAGPFTDHGWETVEDLFTKMGSYEQLLRYRNVGAKHLEMVFLLAEHLLHHTPSESISPVGNSIAETVSLIELDAREQLAYYTKVLNELEPLKAELARLQESLSPLDREKASKAWTAFVTKVLGDQSVTR